MIDFGAILEANAVPAALRDPVIALATLLSDVAVRDVKRELIQLCQSHPELTAQEISLIVARSLHSGPLAIDGSPPVSSVNPALFTSSSEAAA